MAIYCASGEKLVQEATGIRRGWVYRIAKNCCLKRQKYIQKSRFELMNCHCCNFFT